MIYVEEVNPSAGKVFKDLVHQALFPLNRKKKDTDVQNVEIDYFQPRKQWNSLWKSNQQDHASSINFHSFISTPTNSPAISDLNLSSQFFNNQPNNSFQRQ
ncbi:hypothetical protein NC651_001724 [Populus alba x Populus x berolinensis]|nr:hypothetical protein NC651_001724 [Populus alba x Populus x berolinensis]